MKEILTSVGTYPLVSRCKQLTKQFVNALYEQFQEGRNPMFASASLFLLASLLLACMPEQLRSRSGIVTCGLPVLFSQ